MAASKRPSNSLSRLIWELIAAAAVVIAFLFMSTKNHERENNLIASINTHEKDENYLRMLSDELKKQYETLKEENRQLENDNNQLLEKMNSLNVKLASQEKQLLQKVITPSELGINAVAPLSSTTQNIQTTAPLLQESSLEGVAIVCCLDGPGWLQNRYSMSVMNIMEGLPKNWKVQLFHKGSVQSFKGLTRNPGVRRLVEANRIIVTEIQGSWSKRSRSELYLSPYFWQQVLAPKVLMFGHGGVICHNSPFTLQDFMSYDLCSSPDGGFVILNKQFVIDFLLSVLAEGQEYLPKIHGPIPYLLGHLRKQGNINVAPNSVVDNMVLSTTSSWNESVFPLAISGTLSTFTAEARKAAIEKCPEIKMVFPSLDNPGCFGASNTLDKDACINSLCVSSPKQGGC